MANYCFPTSRLHFETFALTLLFSPVTSCTNQGTLNLLLYKKLAYCYDELNSQNTSSFGFSLFHSQVFGVEGKGLYQVPSKFYQLAERFLVHRPLQSLYFGIGAYKEDRCLYFVSRVGWQLSGGLVVHDEQALSSLKFLKLFLGEYSNCRNSNPVVLDGFFGFKIFKIFLGVVCNLGYF